MHDFGDLDLWRQRRAELRREAESGRLARRLRAERPRKGPRLEGGFFEGIRALPSRRKRAAEC